ncbi:MAG: hypothetical protein IJN75_06295 [Clostridia bacterium]|nr:hypothetical protein [Clostridia bacterium]
MTELEKIAYAKSFIDKLANGINPIDNQPVAEYDALNNVRLSRCFFYVSDILRQVIENGGITPPKKQTKKNPSSPFFITQQQLSQYSYSDKPITISEIAKRINSLIDTEQMKQLSYKQIMGFLLSINALSEQPNTYGKLCKFPTETGKQLGLSLETRNGDRGEYQVVVYNKEAQMLILDNIEVIIATKN